MKFGEADERLRAQLPMSITEQPHRPAPHPHEKRKKKRKIVSNICKDCRSNKAKCSGVAPCNRCVQDGIDCIFTDQAQEPMQQQLFATAYHLADVRQQLATTQQRLSCVQQDVFNAQRDLSSSHLKLLMSQQDYRNQRRALENIFYMLHASQDSAAADLRRIVLECLDAAEFVGRMASIRVHSSTLANSDQPSEAHTSIFHPAWCEGAYRLVSN